MRSRQVAVGLVLISLVSITAENLGHGQEPMRQWSSRDGNQSVEASFQSYNPKSKQVSLQLQSGESIQVDLTYLSRSDQRHVKKVARENLNGVGKNTGEIVAAVEKNLPSRTRVNSSKIVTAYGIHWTPGIETALRSAAGNESIDDDRPVMWLRVLGELDGFM